MERTTRPPAKELASKGPEYCLSVFLEKPEAFAAWLDLALRARSRAERAIWGFGEGEPEGMRWASLAVAIFAAYADREKAKAREGLCAGLMMSEISLRIGSIARWGSDPSDPLLSDQILVARCRQLSGATPEEILSDFPFPSSRRMINARVLANLFRGASPEIMGLIPEDLCEQIAAAERAIGRNLAS